MARYVVERRVCGRWVQMGDTHPTAVYATHDMHDRAKLYPGVYRVRGTLVRFKKYKLKSKGLAMRAKTKEVLPPGVYKVGEFARLTGMTRSTVHQYILIGLLMPVGRTVGGQRLYNEESLGRIKRIRDMQGDGLTLGEIKRLREA